MWLKFPTPVIKDCEDGAGAGTFCPSACAAMSSTAAPLILIIDRIGPPCCDLNATTIPFDLRRGCGKEESWVLGLFDSGLGGLSVVREIQKKLPQYSLIYLGDNARTPYGSPPPAFPPPYTTWGSGL